MGKERRGTGDEWVIAVVKLLGQVGNQQAVKLFNRRYGHFHDEAIRVRDVLALHNLRYLPRQIGHAPDLAGVPVLNQCSLHSTPAFA